jgi:hypothetical protein
VVAELVEAFIGRDSGGRAKPIAGPTKGKIMDRFRNSWELFKSSFAVMLQNKTLLVFPILISALSALLVGLFIVPVAFQRTGFGYGTAQHWVAVGQSVYNFRSESSDVSPPAAADGSRGVSRIPGRRLTFGGVKALPLAYFALMYFATMFLATFLNVAFYREILNALRGQPVSIAAGLQFAATKWKIILMWTLFAGLVGFVIKTLEERLDFVGEWIMSLIGAVWSIACVFVIPVIVTEEETVNPLAVLKKSATTLRNTWGESLIGYAGVGLGGFIVMFFSLLCLGAGIAAAVALRSFWLGAGVVLGWLAAVITFSYLMSVASQIFRCALFLYASEGSLPQPYTPQMMTLAWKTKKA